MTFSIVDAATAALAGGGLLLLYKLSQIGRREKYLPPGPPTLPLLGNLHAFPKHDAHIQFAKWAKQYGEIYSLKMAHQTAIVISSPAAVREIMEKQSGVTADRPSLHMANLITSGGKHMAISRYNDDWKKLRRGAREILTPESCARHLPIQQAEATQLMHDILIRPSEFYSSVRRFSFSVILSILFGKRTPQIDNPQAKTFYRAIQMWEEILEPGAQPPVDLIPILKKVPERFAKWKTLCKEIRSLQIGLYFGLLEEVEERVDIGEANGCWMETVVERAESWGMSRLLAGHLGGTLMEGGADTTASLMLTFILAMVAFPEAQQKAQEEIDRVIGPNRAPTIEDMEKLPYVQAVIQEVQRFRPASPLVFPHASTADITVREQTLCLLYFMLMNLTQYKGYCIPSGTTIFVNTWGIYHDDKLYENEAVFDPDRFLNNKFGVREDIVNETSDWREDLGFGCGRRFCPGVHLAKNSLAINITNLLWAFNFGKTKDPETGAEIQPDVWDYTRGNLTCPNPFNCMITPRSAQHARIIEQEFQAATSAFIPFEQGLSVEDRQFLARQRATF